MKDIAEES
jgi:hypothetical protein